MDVVLNRWDRWVAARPSWAGVVKNLNSYGLIYIIICFFKSLYILSLKVYVKDHLHPKIFNRNLSHRKNIL